MQNILRLMIGLGWFFLQAGNTLATAASPAEIYQAVAPSVATLAVETKTGESFVASAAVVYDDTTLVTAWHAVYDAGQIVASFADGQEFQVEGIVDYDEHLDLALLRVATTGRKPLPLSEDKPLIGSWVYAIGSPRGYGFSIAEGLLSGVRDIDDMAQYQISCPFSPGNSGGPVIGEDGRIMGIASWSKRNAQNVNFAIPANYINSLDRLHAVTPLERVPSKGGSSSDSQLLSVSGKEDYENFQSALLKHRGQKVTLTLHDGEQEKTYSFHVPE